MLPVDTDDSLVVRINVSFFMPSILICWLSCTNFEWTWNNKMEKKLLELRIFIFLRTRLLRTHQFRVFDVFLLHHQNCSLSNYCCVPFALVIPHLICFLGHLHRRILSNGSGVPCDVSNQNATKYFQIYVQSVQSLTYRNIVECIISDTWILDWPKWMFHLLN